VRVSRGLGSTPTARRLARRRPVSPPVVLLLAAAVSLFGLVPLGYVVITAVSTGWPTLSRLLWRPRVAELLLNTVSLVVVTVPLCALVGIVAAWLVERSTIAGPRVFAVLLAAPLAIPAFVNSYGWVSVVPSLHGLWSGVLVAGLSYFPLVYLPCVASLRRLDPAVEEAARSLGRSPLVTFVTVVLPQLRLPILGGSLLIALHLLSEYGAFALIRFDTFTTAIVEQYRSTFNGPAANALAGVLVLCCLVVLCGETALRGRARFSRVGSGSPRPVPRHRLRRLAPLGYVFLLSLTGLSIGVPVLSVARWLVLGDLQVWSDRFISAALLQTLAYGLLAALATCAAAAPIAFLAVRFPGPLVRVLESITYVTSSLPALVAALALVTVTIRLAQPLYQTSALVVLAYLIVFLPRAVVNLRAGLSQVPPGLEEAAGALGVRPVLAFVRVTLRFVAPSALAGGALVFLGVVNELTATLLLAPNGTRTLATQFWSKVNDIDYVGAAPYATLMILASLPVTYFLFVRARVQSG